MEITTAVINHYALRAEEEREPGVIYVTDLVYCPVKRLFALRLAPRPAPTPAAIVGSLLHAGAELVLREIYGDRIVTELEGNLSREKPVRLVDGAVVRVRGRIDAVLDGEIGVELKFAAAPPAEPKEWHVEQAKLYNWLYGFRYTILAYFSFEGIREYRVKERYTDEEVAAIVEEHLRGRPAPRWDWECRYCPYAAYCPFTPPR